MGPDELQVTVSKDQIKDAPNIEQHGDELSQSDESALYTAYRETWEEIGVDLAEREFVQVGRLDEREITTSLGKRLLMILSPFGVFSLNCYWSVGGMAKLNATKSSCRRRLLRQHLSFKR